MKTTAFGISGLAIVFFTIVAVLQLVSGHTRETNLQNHLQQALESSLKTAMDGDRSYDIQTDEELVADVLEGLAVRMDGNCDLRVEVTAIDRDKGILSVKATAYYMSRNGDKNGDGVIDKQDAISLEPVDWNGDGVVNWQDDINGDEVLDEKDALVSVVTAQRTILLERYDVSTMGKHTVLYQTIDASGREATYKKYILTTGTKLLCPADPSVNFEGAWYHKEEDKWYTRQDIEAMTVTQDVTFYNQAN